MSDQGKANFGLQYIYENEVSGWLLSVAKGNGTGTTVGAIRPMIEIPLNKVTLGATGEGTSSSPYSLTAK